MTKWIPTETMKAARRRVDDVWAVRCCPDAEDGAVLIRITDEEPELILGEVHPDVVEAAREQGAVPVHAPPTAARRVVLTQTVATYEL